MFSPPALMHRSSERSGNLESKAEFLDTSKFCDGMWQQGDRGLRAAAPALGLVCPLWFPQGTARCIHAACWSSYQTPGPALGLPMGPRDVCLPGRKMTLESGCPG